MTAPGLIWSPGEFPAEVVKARSLPVPGAVLIAPLTQSWRNYGSAGGEFTRISTPTITSEGASFPITSGAQIVTGWFDSFTTVTRAKVTDFGSSFAALIAVAQSAVGSAGWGINCGADNTVWWINARGAGGESFSSVQKNGDWHTFTLTYASAVIALYLDGALITQHSISITGGTILTLSSLSLGSTLDYPSGSIHRNCVMYASSLSSVERALVEAWAAA